MLKVNTLFDSLHMLESNRVFSISNHKAVMLFQLFISLLGWVLYRFAYITMELSIKVDQPYLKQKC